MLFSIHPPVESGDLVQDDTDPLNMLAVLLLALKPALAWIPFRAKLDSTPSNLHTSAFEKPFRSAIHSIRGAEVYSRKDINDLKVGDEVEGRVKSVVPFGVFMDIGASKDALLHRSQMSAEFVPEAPENYKRGDIIKCRIREIDLAKEQIALTDSDVLHRTPWHELKAGQKVVGKVKRITYFGVFMDIGATKDALLHESELVDGDIEKAQKEMRAGDLVKCRIVNINLQKGFISLAHELPAFGEPIVFTPDTGSIEAAVIWLHGFGDQPDDWASEFEPLRSDPSALGWKWVHLRAPYIAQPMFRGEMWPAWGQFFNEEILHVGGQDYEHPDDAGWYAACGEVVKNEIEALIEEGVPPEKIIVGGFSQGGALALQTVASIEHRLGGCVVFSGWATSRARKALRNGHQAGTPLLIGHGKEDDLVDYDCAKRARDIAKQAGLEVKFYSYAEMKHAFCIDELYVFKNFLHEHLSSTPPDI